MTTWAEPKQLALLADPLDVQFAEHHHAHPEIYAAIVDLCRDWKDAGHDRIGMGMVFEVLRWRRGMRASGDAYAMNHNWRSRYARLVMANEPDLFDMFETRRLHGDGDYS